MGLDRAQCFTGAWKNEEIRDGHWDEAADDPISHWAEDILVQVGVVSPGVLVSGERLLFLESEIIPVHFSVDILDVFILPTSIIFCILTDLVQNFANLINTGLDPFIQFDVFSVSTLCLTHAVTLF